MCGCGLGASRLTVRMRRAVDSDVKALQRWERAEHVWPVVSADGARNWEAEIRHPWQEVWIAVVEGSDIGVLIVLDAEADPGRYWQDLAVDSVGIDIWIGETQALHRGFGCQMMNFGLSRARQLNRSRVVLDPVVNNKEAISFYEHLGFSLHSRRNLGTELCHVMHLNLVADVPVT